MQHRRISGVFFFLFFAIYVVTAWAQEPVMAAKTYRGPEGMTLTIVPIETAPGDPRSLVEITGHPALGDKKIYLTQVKTARGEESYQTLRTAKPMVIARRVHSYGGTYIAAPKLNNIGEYNFQYPSRESDARAIQRDGAEVIADYFSKRKAPAGAPREALLKEAEGRLQSLGADLKRRCAAELKLTLKSDSFPDEMLREHDLGAMCARGASALLRVCKDELGREAVKQKIAAVECAGGSTPPVALSEKTLRIGLDSQSGETDTAVEEYLLNAL
jgi:hypothetical protein